MGGFALLRLCVGASATLALLVSCRAREKIAAPPEASAPAPEVRGPPSECASDKDCAPDNCCFAREETSCVPTARAFCRTSAIQCEQYAGPRYACACVGGKCGGTLDVTVPARPDAGPPAWASGALLPSVVLDVIIRRGDDVRACHALAKSANGAVGLTWKVLPSGNVERPAVLSSTAGAPLGGCLVKKVGAWRFPRAGGPTTVTYQFRFGT